MGSEISAAIRLGRELEAQQNAAVDFWSWLPSYAEARKWHGDYACEHMPSVTDLLREASLFISHKLNPTKEQLAESGEWYTCPCGESHDDAKQE
jgi:hypothetical protein